MRGFYIVIFYPKPKSGEKQLKFSIQMGDQSTIPGLPQDLFK